MSFIFRTIYALNSISRTSRNLPWEQVPPVRPDTVSVIYHRRPPLWAKFGGVLFALNAMMVFVCLYCIILLSAFLKCRCSTSILEYTWDFSGLASRNKVALVEQAETVNPEDEVLPVYFADRLRMQPFAKKVFFSGVYFISGAAFMFWLLAQRARLLRTVTLARPGSGPNAKRSGTLYFQTAVHPAGYGIAFPIKDVSIVRTDIPSKLILRVTGLGGWELNVNGATINGKTMPKNKIDDSRVAMLRAWNAIGGRVGIPKAKT
jgi:hypothetical protein